jgi:phospholipase C
MANSQRDPIEHVIVLMLENRSFDQMLGDFQRQYPTLDGIAPGSPPRSEMVDGHAYEQQPTSVHRASADPNHELASVLRQIGAPVATRGFDCRRAFLLRLFLAVCLAVWSWIVWAWRWARGRLQRPVMRAEFRPPYESHFVAEYIRSFPASTTAQRNEIMGYFPIETLPALHQLAENFTICDRWFASVPGPTWVNRFFVHTGTSRGVARMPNDFCDFTGFALYDQRTIYDELNARDKTWRIYFHDIAQTLVLARQWQSQNRPNYAHIDRFEADVAGPVTNFPAFVFIEPQYAGDEPNDDHAPYDVMAGEALIARVYNAIRCNDALWQSTLLIIAFDEHGGYYDHVEPPGAPPPDRCTLEYTFDRLGVRVPVVLVSPWVPAGVFPDNKSVHFDHTSIGRYLCDKWGLQPLGERMRQAHGVGEALRLNDPPRLDALPRIAPVPAGQAGGVTMPNENQVALDLLSKYLDQQTAGRASSRTFGKIPETKPDPDAMRSRVLRFLNRG